VFVTIGCDIIGTDNDIVCDTITGNIVNHESKWLYTHARRRHDLLRIDHLIKLHGREIDVQPPKAYVVAFKQLGCSQTTHINWQKSMSSQSFKKWISEIARDLERASKDLDRDYYIETFRPTEWVLNQLQRPAIDTKMLAELTTKEKNPTTLSIILTFSPLEDKLAQDITYNRFSSRTGRLIITSGPQILTLKKDYRKLIKSRYNNGKIIKFDYRSFEARLAMSIAGMNPTDVDVYESLRQTIFNNKLVRDQAKIATLSALFGIGPKELAKRLNVNISTAKNVIEFIKKKFAFNETVATLTTQLQKTGKILNHYGRPVSVNSKSLGTVYNTLIQSTGVDAALLGFKQILCKMKDMHKKSVPLFVLHDALLIDIENPTNDDIDTLAKSGEAIPG